MDKKKLIVIVISIITIILVAIGCIYIYKNAGQEPTKIISTNPIFTMENYPRVDASLATQPLTNAFIKNFVDENINTEEIEYTNTHPAYVKLINGETDLIVVTEPSEEELRLAKEKGVELEVIPVVKEGFVFFVNSENQVDNLKLEQIQKIYTGEITNWKDVGGENNSIIAYQRPANSGSQTGMLSLVMKGLKIMEPKTEELVDTMFAIVNLVAAYKNEKTAIGYSYYYYATTMYDEMDSEVANRIKLIAINGVKPNEQTIKDGTYPLQTAYYIVIRKDEKQDSQTRKLVNAMLSERGQKVAKEAGYVPVK